MSAATRRVGLAGMRICALVDPQHAEQIVELVQELIEASASEAFEQASKTKPGLYGCIGTDGVDPATAASQSESPRAVTVYGPDTLSALIDETKAESAQAPTPTVESSNDAASGASEPSPAPTDDAPRGTSDEPPAERHADTVRTLAEIPNDERDQIYARWLGHRQRVGKVPADELTNIARAFNTTPKVVYNYTYFRFNAENKRAAERPAQREPATPPVSVSDRQKALSRIAPPAPRAERLKVRRVTGTYGGGE